VLHPQYLAAISYHFETQTAITFNEPQNALMSKRNKSSKHSFQLIAVRNFVLCVECNQFSFQGRSGNFIGFICWVEYLLDRSCLQVIRIKSKRRLSDYKILIFDGLAGL